MVRTTLTALILGSLLMVGGGILFASEADELRMRAMAMRKEAALLAERGNREQAERLARESIALTEAADRLDSRARDKERGEKGERTEQQRAMQQLKERLQDLHAVERKLRETKLPDAALAEVREQIARTERELQLRQAERGEHKSEYQAHAEKLAAAIRRIHHLRVAAENLKMAEAHELAREILNKAEAMERDVREARSRLEAEMKKAHGKEHGPDLLRELRGEIERLRAEVKELRDKAEKR